MLADDREASFQTRQYRLLAREGAALAPEIATPDEFPPNLGEGI